MSGISLPIPKNYFDTRDQARRLKAPVWTVRALFVLQGVIAAVIFAVTYYIGSNNTSEETKVTYTTLSGYSCNVLAPRSGMEAYSAITSNLVQFNFYTLSLSDCFLQLGTSGFDVCSDAHRHDLILSAIAISSTSSTCYDLVLTNGYRFCFGGEVENEIENREISYIRQGGAPEPQITDSFYYVNSSSSVTAISGDVSSSDLESDLLTGDDDAVFGVFSTETTDSRVVVRFTTKGVSQTMFDFTSGAFSGFAISSTGIFTYAVSESTYTGNLFKLNTVTTTRSQFSLNCDTFEDQTSSSAEITRWLSTDENGNLFAMCSSSSTITADKSQFSFSQYYEFYKLDPNNGNVISTYRVDFTPFSFVEKDGTTTTRSIDRVYQILVYGGYAYIDAGSNSNGNIFKVDLSSQPTLQPTFQPTLSPTTAPTNPPPPGSGRRRLQSSGNIVLQPMSFLTTHRGTYLTMLSTGDLYEHDYQNRKFNLATEQFQTGEENTDYTLVTAVQLAYNYQICNGNLSNFIVDASLSSFFNTKCGATDGVYYQDNRYITVPNSCVGVVSGGNITAANIRNQLLTCPAMVESTSNFTSTACTDSIATVCKTAFTDNPPYSCVRSLPPGTVIVLANSFSYAAASWTISFLAFNLLLKLLYPNGYLNVPTEEEDEDERYHKKQSNGVIKVDPRKVAHAEPLHFGAEGHNITSNV